MDFKIEENRIYATNIEGKTIAEITFTEIDKGIFNIEHTFVDESLRGKGIANILVEKAIKEITKKKGQIEATCSYARRYLEKKTKNAKKSS